jgi:ribosomal protein L37AE/L43A
MMLSPTCACCELPLLRHIRSSKVYWYCHHCHAEMPDLRKDVLTMAKSQLERLMLVEPYQHDSSLVELV